MSDVTYAIWALQMCVFTGLCKEKIFSHDQVIGNQARSIKTLRLCLRGFFLVMRRCYATVRCVEFLLELTNVMILEQLMMLRYLLAGTAW